MGRTECGGSGRTGTESTEQPSARVRRPGVTEDSRMNFSLPTTLGDWTVIVAAIVVTHLMFKIGSTVGLWHSDGAHLQLGKG